MGFTTGFTGGVTLTLGIAYLTVLAHERNRQSQAQHLRFQSTVLTSLLEPPPLPPPRSRGELAREERSTLTETTKDRWNEEVENAVRWVQRTDWNEVREGMEGAIARLLGGGLQKSRDGIEVAEKQAGPKVQEAIDRSKAAAKTGAERATAQAKEGAARIADSAKATADRAVASTKEKLDQTAMKTSEYKETAKAKADRTAADAKSGAHDAADSIRSSGETVDAARGALRDVVSKGIEKGKEVIGKAQAAVGLATDKSQPQSANDSSAVEKALHERYEKPDGLNKTVEETLEERYKPIDSRNNSVLRGV